MRLQGLMLFILLWMSPSQSSDPLCVQTQTGLISILQKHFLSGCVYLVDFYNKPGRGLIYKKNMFDFQKLISEKQIALGWLNAATLPTVRCQRNRALHILLSNGEDARLILRQVFADSLSRESRWLWLVDNDMNFHEELRGVDIPFDCEFLVSSGCETLQLTEVYRVQPSLPLQTSHWGNWSAKEGLRAPALGLYERRNDLQGALFRVGALDMPPFLFMIKDESGNPTRMLDGLYGAACQELAQQLNFSVEVRPVGEERHGEKQRNGTWNGLIGMTLNGEIDISGSTIEMNEERTQILSFTMPISTSKMLIYVRPKLGSETKWFGFLSLFSFSLWLAIGGIMLLVACCLATLHGVAQRHVRVEMTYNLWDSFFCVWGSFWAQGDSISPHLICGRVAFWTSFVTGLVVCTAFSANIISSLTVPKKVLPFTDVQGLVDNKQYGFGYGTKAMYGQILQNSKDRAFRELYIQKVLPDFHKVPETTLSALERACNSKYALMSIDLNMKIYGDKISCELSELTGDVYPVTLGFVLKKTSPFLRVINMMLQKMIQCGIYKRLSLQWFPPALTKESDPPRSLGLADVLPILTLCAGGALIGIICLILELRILKRLRRVPKEDKRTVP